jgi:hypothetical protein
MRANKTLQRQRGSGLVTALFVLVAGAAIGAAFVQLNGGASQSGSLSLSQARSRTAAAVGLEWARYRIDRGAVCAAGVLNLTAGALARQRVTVSCARTVHDDGGTPRRAYALTAFAQFGSYGSPDYTSYRATQTLVR